MKHSLHVVSLWYNESPNKYINIYKSLNILLLVFITKSHFKWFSPEHWKPPSHARQQKDSHFVLVVAIAGFASSITISLSIFSKYGLDNLTASTLYAACCEGYSAVLLLAIEKPPQ